MEIARRSVPEMFGDAFREIAILIVVFAPLDRWVERRPYTWPDSWRTFGLGAVLFAIGLAFERLRRS